MIGSPALMQYAHNRLEHSSLFMLISNAPIAIATIAALPSSPDGERGLARMKGVWERFASDMSMDRFQRLCDELWHCRNVDSFQHYVSSMLRTVFMQRPETMRTSETVRMVEVLACSDMNEIVRMFADRKVDALSYQGFDDLLEYLKKTLGLSPKLEDSDVKMAREGIEVRNIVVHNRGRVNHLFLRRTKRVDLSHGQEFPLDQSYVIASAKAMHRLAAGLDAAFIEHFKLQFHSEQSLETPE